MNRFLYKKIYTVTTLGIGGALIGRVLNDGFIDKSNLSWVILGPSLILCGLSVWFNRNTWFDK